MLLFRGCLLLLLLFSSPGNAAFGDSDWLYRGSDLPRDSSWQLGTLPNGVRYAIRQNAVPAGEVSIRVRIHAGALNEEDGEQGWAHFVEHLVFRGTSSFEDGQAGRIWQQLGAGPGSDSNAFTGLTQTVYQLDLPRNDRASLDQSLAILAEMMDSARFEPAAVESERRIVLAEKSRRSQLGQQLSALADPLFYAGLKQAERNIIGTDQTLAAATPAALEAFYERWYRPDRTTVVIVGDADPALLSELLAARFGGWQPSGAAPEEPDYGTIAEPSEPVAALAYPGAPFGVQAVWIRPGHEEPNTIEQLRIDLAERLAIAIINRRLEGQARLEASFLSAGLGVSNWRGADVTNLNVSVRDSRWQEAISDSLAILADALRSPPSENEIARELSDRRSAARAAVDGANTARSAQRAASMVNVVDAEDVPISEAARLELFDRVAPDLTPAVVQATMRRLLSGAGPRLVLVSPVAVDGVTAAIKDAIAAGQTAVSGLRPADRIVTFDALPRLGPPGEEVSRQHVEDMGATIVRFANGSTLTFKHTDFRQGSVSVVLRFGNGIAGLSPERPTPAAFASVVARTGLADLDLDGMERLLTGRRMGLNFGVEESTFLLSGSTSPEELADQLRLLALKLAYPRWDDGLFNRQRATSLDRYDLSFASAAARAGRERAAILHPGDARWLPMDRETMAGVGADDFRRFFEPLLASGPIQAIIVGDVDLEPAVAAVAASIGALPSRPEPPPVSQASPPQPDATARIFTHAGDPGQAYAMVGWTTTGRAAPIRDRRALSLAAAIMRDRLFERLREEEGATYSPNFSSFASETFPDWGVFLAEAQVKPESVEAFFRITREAVADLALRPVPDEEFARARNPIVSRIAQDAMSNGYWLAQLAGWPKRPELIEQTRSLLADYQQLTPEEVRAAVSAYVVDEGDWSMLVLPEN